MASSAAEKKGDKRKAPDDWDHPPEWLSQWSKNREGGPTGTLQVLFMQIDGPPKPMAVNFGKRQKVDSSKAESPKADVKPFVVMYQMPCNHRLTGPLFVQCISCAASPSSRRYGLCRRCSLVSSF